MMRAGVGLIALLLVGLLGWAVPAVAATVATSPSYRIAPSATEIITEWDTCRVVRGQ